MASVNEPLGALQMMSTTEDRTLYVYRPKRRLTRGILLLSAALLFVTLAVYLGRPTGRWYGWMFAILPSIAASAAGYCGMIDLLNRPLFQLEVDRRARSLALAMPREKGQALAKVRFADVASVEIREKGPPASWNVTLMLRNGRRIGLGISDDKAASDETALRFSELIGVGIVRTPPA
jgi:hypothetical protein